MSANDLSLFCGRAAWPGASYVMQSILVSACLLGETVRYDGGDRRCAHPVLLRWRREGRVVAVCPEVAGGLPVPRPAAEIAGAAGGWQVLAGVARVVDAGGRDYSPQFVSGARQALELARANNIRIAVLKEGSPSCGSGFGYDGTFTATRVAHAGVTAALLQRAGIQVFSEDGLAQADSLLRRLEAGSAAGLMG
jgi:uncharacterized protein YbbK (DUF523 family)